MEKWWIKILITKKNKIYAKIKIKKKKEPKINSVKTFGSFIKLWKINQIQIRNIQNRNWNKQRTKKKNK